MVHLDAVRINSFEAKTMKNKQMSQTKHIVPGLDELSSSEIVLAKSEIALEKLEKVAAKSMYLNLLTGQYNRQYSQRLSEEDAKLKEQKPTKSSARSVPLSLEDFPDHLMDKVVSTGLGRPSLFYSTFDRFFQGKTIDFQGIGSSSTPSTGTQTGPLLATNLQDRRNTERNMYLLACAQKHAFVRKYSRHRGFAADQLHTKNSVKQAYWKLSTQAFVTANIMLLLMIYRTKMYRNRSLLPIAAGLTVNGVTAVFCNYNFSRRAFDEVPNLQEPVVEEERQQILLNSLGVDYSSTILALKQEMELSRPPADYIYATLLR